MKKAAQWEYEAKIFRGGDKSGEEKKKLAAMGLDGWEAFQVILSPSNNREYLVFFKRELQGRVAQ